MLTRILLIYRDLTTQPFDAEAALLVGSILFLFAVAGVILYDLWLMRREDMRLAREIGREVDGE